MKTQDGYGYRGQATVFRVFFRFLGIAKKEKRITVARPRYPLRAH